MSYVARRYAKALHDAKLSEAALSEAVDLIFKHPPLWDALCSPVISLREKEAVLAALSPFDQEPRLLRFMTLLLHGRRIGLLRDINEELRQLTLADGQITEVLVRCVHIPDEARCARLRERLQLLHKKEHLRLVFREEPALLGGYIVTLDGMTYDQSVRGKLLGLSRYLEEVNAI